MREPSLLVMTTSSLSVAGGCCRSGPARLTSGREENCCWYCAARVMNSCPYTAPWSCSRWAEKTEAKIIPPHNTHSSVSILLGLWQLFSVHRSNSEIETQCLQLHFHGCGFKALTFASSPQRGLYQYLRVSHIFSQHVQCIELRNARTETVFGMVKRQDLFKCRIVCTEVTYVLRL